MKTPLALLAAAVAAPLVCAAGAGHAADYRAGDLTIEQPWARATPAGATVGAAYLTILNHGRAPDRLLGASVDGAGHVALHTTLHEGGTMRMRMLEALDVPAAAATDLKPGGTHLMLMDLAAPLAEGGEVSATLHFARAGDVPVTVAVRGAGAQAGDHGGHGHP